MLRVLKAGMFTTVQDAGRQGYQAFGISVAGAMDYTAYRAANILVGNGDSEAVLELTMFGGSYTFTETALAAITGADMEATLDGEPLKPWSSFTVQPGSVLNFGFAQTGCRAYLSVHGGFDVPIVLGSRATHTRSRVGGLQGRILRDGDEITFGSVKTTELTNCELPHSLKQSYHTEISVRVILGPQQESFTAAGIATLFNAQYTLTAEADRMGYRLEGAPIEHSGSADIVSDALCQGAIQVPAHGRPIIMMSDRQTTGGYTKIGTVITADLALLAQAKPGDKIRFVATDDETAVKAIIARNKYLSQLTEFVRSNSEERKKTVAAIAGAIVSRQNIKVYKISFNGKSFVAEVAEK